MRSTGSTAAADPTGDAQEHGGRLSEARRRFPAAPTPFLDLSTGINPVPYPVPAVHPGAWARLPEPEATAALAEAAAARYGAPLGVVVPAPGTQSLIGLLPLVAPHRRVAVLGPTYGEHASAWRRSGAEVTVVDRLEALEPAACAVLCNPNNPDGARWPPAALLALADRLAERDGLLVIDEAFADVDPEVTVAPHLPHPAIVALRSFGKAYGLAGLRLGFALAPPPIARRLRAALGPWPVSGPAVAVGTAALADGPWLATSAARLRRDAGRLDALLEAAGLRVLGGTALFRLAQAPDAPARFERLGQAGILARRFEARPEWLRFGLPADQPAWDRLAAALGR